MRPAPNNIVDWFSTLLTAELAVWACNTALEIIRALVQMIPPGMTRMMFMMIENRRPKA